MTLLFALKAFHSGLLQMEFQTQIKNEVNTMILTGISSIIISNRDNCSFHFKHPSLITKQCFNDWMLQHVNALILKDFFSIYFYLLAHSSLAWVPLTLYFIQWAIYRHYWLSILWRNALNIYSDGHFDLYSKLITFINCNGEVLNNEQWTIQKCCVSVLYWRTSIWLPFRWGRMETIAFH